MSQIQELDFHSDIISDLKIYNTHYSKYGTEYMMYCSNNKVEKVVNIASELKKDVPCLNNIKRSYR